MKVPIICYKVKVPKVYDNGSTSDHFLSHYFYDTFEEAEKEAQRLNTEKPERLFNGQKINWNWVDYFYASVQEEMY